MTSNQPTENAALATRSFRRESFSLHYLEGGDRANPTVLLCHGLGAGKEQFSDDAAFFVQQGYHVLVPDLRGHGQSKTPSHFTETSFSLVAYANDILELADGLGIEKLHFVGNSLGGLVGLTILRLRPLLVETFATFGTTYSLKTSSFTMGLAKFVNQLIPPSWVGDLGAKAVSRNAHGQAVMKKLLEAANPKVTSLTMSHIAEYDLISVAGNSPKPMLLLRAEHDKQINAAIGPTIKELSVNSNFKVVEVPGAAHCANLDAPDQIREELLTHFASAS